MKTIELSKSEVLEMLTQYERAYRRGFQQGHHSQIRLEGPESPTEYDVFEYRYETPLDKDYTAPERPGEKPHPLMGSVYERFDCECNTEEAKQLSYKLASLLEASDE